MKTLEFLIQYRFLNRFISLLFLLIYCYSLIVQHFLYCFLFIFTMLNILLIIDEKLKISKIIPLNHHDKQFLSKKWPLQSNHIFFLKYFVKLVVTMCTRKELFNKKLWFVFRFILKSYKRIVGWSNHVK